MFLSAPGVLSNTKMGSILRAACSVLGLLVLSACSSVKPWINRPLTSEQAKASYINVTRNPEVVMAVTISGGGARAAAFGYGVLRALDEVHLNVDGQSQTLLEWTDLISGVSGGSIVATYYAAFGREGLPRFESEFLRRDFQHGLISSLFHPTSLHKLSSPWYGRSNLLESQLNDLYRGMTFADLEAIARHPQLIVTATDLTRGNGFEFTRDQFGLICSDLGSVPLSFAVAASSAVPLVLSPLTMKNYSSQCPAGHPADWHTAKLGSLSGEANYRQRIYAAEVRQYLDSHARPWLHLVDGGLADNLGVQRMLDRALLSGGLRQTFSQMDIPPGIVKRVVLVVINAERDPSRNLDLSEEVPGMLGVADALLFGSGSRATNETQEYLRDVVATWREHVDQSSPVGINVFAPHARFNVITVNLRDAPIAERSRLMQVATAFSVPDQEVRELIAAGRDVLQASPDFQALVRELGGRLNKP